MPDPNLDDLLLQAAGRTVGKGGQSRQSNQRWQQHGRRAGGSYSGGSGSDGSDDGDSDSDVAPSNPRKRLPPGSQVPLKKRHQTGKGGGRGGGGYDDEDPDDEGRRSGGEDSESAPSVRSDLYKEQLENMTELQREMILAERSTRIDDYKLKKLARASSSKTDKARKDSPPPPPHPTSQLQEVVGWACTS